MVNWNDIALKHKTDKSTSWSKMQPVGHGYMDKYEKHLAGKTINSILELGVDEGNSLRMWQEIFPNTSIIGLDINPECMRYSEGTILVLCGNASKKSNLEILKCVPYDLIVDDASHKKEDVLLALDTLFSALSPGGTYVIEDMIWDDLKSDIEAWATCKEVIVSVYPSMNSSQSIIFLEKQ